MTFRDDVRRDFAEFIKARDAFVEALAKELRLYWMLDRLEQAITWIRQRLKED